MSKRGQNEGSIRKRADGRWEALLKGEHAGTLLLSPFEILARERGFRLLANAVDVLPRYQGLVGAARRSWAAAHRTELIGYIRAHREALSRAAAVPACPRTRGYWLLARRYGAGILSGRFRGFLRVAQAAISPFSRR